MKNLIKILLGVAILSNMAMAVTGNVNIKVKAVDALTINATEMDFGTFIVGDSGPLTADSTITVDHITNVSGKTVEIETDPTVTLTNGSESISVELALDKSKLDSTNSTATATLTGTIDEGGITAVGDYSGTAEVRVKYN